MENKEIKALTISAVVFLVVNLILAAIIGIAGGIATKADIQAIKYELKGEIELVRKELKGDIELVRKDIKHFQSTVERLEASQTKTHDTLITHLQNHK